MSTKRTTKPNLADLKAEGARMNAEPVMDGTDLVTKGMAMYGTEAREAVAKAARDTLTTSATLTKRASVLGEALAAMRSQAEADGVRFKAYAEAAALTIREAGDWTRADMDIRKAVAAIVGTVGGLSSVMVGEALGMNQTTASRAIRQAKAAEVARVTEEAREAARAEYMAEVESRGEEADAKAREAYATKAAERARAKAEREAAKVVTSAGYEMTSGRGKAGTVARKGRTVAKAAREAAESVLSLADGTVSAEEVETLAATLTLMAEEARALVESIRAEEAKRQAEAMAAEAAKMAERQAKAAERGDKAVTKRLASALASVGFGSIEEAEAMLGAEAVSKFREAAERATLAAA